jgi:hypothetical protein
VLALLSALLRFLVIVPARFGRVLVGGRVGGAMASEALCVMRRFEDGGDDRGRVARQVNVVNLICTGPGMIEYYYGACGGQGCCIRAHKPIRCRTFDSPVPLCFDFNFSLKFCAQ